MIQSLPPRSRRAFVEYRRLFLDLMRMVRSKRPVSMAMVYHEVREMFDMLHDVETDVNADMAELAELAARWDLDDVVELAPQTREEVSA